MNRPRAGGLNEALLKGIHVLLVDDDADSRAVLEEVFSFCGALVTVAASTASALASLERVVPDIILSDVSLPGEDGYAFLGHVRTMPSASHVPAIATSGYPVEEELTRARLAGFQAYLEKPLNLEELCVLIRELVAGATPATTTREAEGE
jgi:two-component system CheB/CheR fusion protein